MKKILLLIITATFLFACGKTDNNQTLKCDAVTTTAPAAEVAALKTYLDTNHIAYTADARGFFYHVDSAGSGSKPTICNVITIDYAGYLLNGTLFDHASNASFNLSQLITGWQEAFPLLNQGGKMTFYAPPSLGYGSQATGPIPANSNLKFVVTLNGVN